MLFRSAMCNSAEAFSVPSQNLRLNSYSQTVKIDAFNIQSAVIDSSTVIIRNQGGDGVVGDIQVDHSTLILCGYKSFVSIKGTSNTVIVIGGSIQELALSSSTVLLGNASVEFSNSSSSTVKSFILK